MNEWNLRRWDKTSGRCREVVAREGSTYMLLQDTNINERYTCSVCVEQLYHLFLNRICAEMAELSTNAREYEKAINFYKEGLTYDDTHIPVRVRFFRG